MKTVLITGEPIRLTFTKQEEEEQWAHVGRMEAGATATAYHAWLAQILADRGLAPLPEDFVWHLKGLDFSIHEVAK